MAWWARKERGRYMIGWREKDGRRRYKTLKSFEEARTFKSNIENQINRGEYASKDDRKIPLGLYMDNVLAGGDLGPSTLAAYGYKRKHTRSIEHIPLGDVTTSDIRGLMGKMEAAGVGAPTRASVRKLLSKVFTIAVNEDLIVKHPVKGVVNPRSERRQIRIYTPQEIAAIAGAIMPKARAGVFLSAYGGLRGGEVGGLKVNDLDLLRGRVRVDEATYLVRGQARLGEPKTPESRRTVTIPRFVCEELAAHMAAYPPAEDGRVFHRDGRLISSKELGRMFTRVTERIGIGGCWHDLRHTSVALAIKAGAHAKQIQARLGHSTITTTLDVYGHLFPGMDEDLAERMQAYGEETEGKVVSL